MEYKFIYLIIFLLLFILERIYFMIADKFNIIDKPNMRSSHTQVTLRGGGIIFYLSALVYFILSGFEYHWFILGLTAVALISFIDDIKSVSSKLRLLVQILAIILLFYQLNLFDISVWQILLLGFIAVGVLNAYNFMDGINGITGGYSLVILGTLLYINTNKELFIESEFILIVIFSLIIFNFFNFRKRAKCFAGDIGSVSIGLIIIFFITKLIFISNDWTYIILLLVYGVDSVLTIIHRIILREKLSLPHRKHLYQLFANELRIPHLIVSVIYMSIQIIILVGYFCFYEYRESYLIVVLILLSTIYIYLKKKYSILMNSGNK